MKRSVLNAVCALGLSLCVMCAQAVAPDYQDWWGDASQSGMGVSIVQQDDTLVAVWYFFDRDRRGTFLMLAGPLKGNLLEGDLVRSTGPVPGPDYNAAAVTRKVVGKGSIEFKSPSEAFFTYQYDGQSGVIALQRFVYRAVPVSTRAIVTGATEQFGCGNWRIAGGPALQRANVTMHVGLSRTGDNLYDLRLGSIEGAGGKSFWCEAKGLSLIPQGGILNGAGNISCIGRDGNTGEVILPAVVGTKGQVNAKVVVTAQQMNAQHTMLEFGLDFGASAGTQCVVMGSFHGITLPAQ